MSPGSHCMVDLPPTSSPSGVHKYLGGKIKQLSSLLLPQRLLEFCLLQHQLKAVNAGPQEDTTEAYEMIGKLVYNEVSSRQYLTSTSLS